MRVRFQAFPFKTGIIKDHDTQRSHEFGYNIGRRNEHWHSGIHRMDYTLADAERVCDMLNQREATTCDA